MTTIASPSGCRECGRERRGHGLTYSESASYHQWIEPTQAQTLSRMRQRAANRAKATDDD